MIDLFDDYDNLDSEVRAITDKIQDDWTYLQCAETIKELNDIGYTADYGLASDLHSLEKLKKFPLGVSSEIVSKFMASDCYENKDKYYPTVEGVKYMDGTRKSEVYESMRYVYYHDEVFREWFLNEVK